MLRVIVFVNKDELEDIQIINTGEKMENGDTIYKTKYGDIEFKVFHNREDGWEVLLQKVLQIKIEVNNELLAMNLRDIIKT